VAGFFRARLRTGVQAATIERMIDETTVAAEEARESQERNDKRRRKWGCLAYGAMAVSAPLMILALVWMILAIADGQLAAEARQRARDAGDPLTAGEMYALYGETPRSEAVTAEWIAVLEAAKKAEEDPVARRMPILGSRDAKETRDERGLYDEATLARVEPFLRDQAGEALRRAHAARHSAKDVRYSFEFEKGVNGSLEQIMELRGLANLLSLEAEVHTSRGELTKAIESLLTLIATGETLAEAPDPMAYLVRAAIFGVAAHLAMQLIDRAQFSPEDLERLQAAFARQSFQRQLIRAVQASQFQAMHFYASDEPTGSPEFDRVRWLPFRGGDQAMLLDLHREFLEGAEAGFPEAERSAADVDARVEALSDSNIMDRYRYVITVEFGPSLEPYLNCALRAEAQARMCAVCCACERYRQERGEWPASLELLVPDYLAEVPLDPVDDRPLRYEVDGERMIIHSLVHFRPENTPESRTLEDGFASHVLGEPYVPEPEPEPALLSDDPYEAYE
jgi:hypothetical protein